MTFGAGIHENKKQMVTTKRARDSLSHNPIPIVAQQLLSKHWLLCLDEFQVIDIGDAMILKQLFAELFKLGAVLVTTSNRAPDGLHL